MSNLSDEVHQLIDDYTKLTNDLKSMCKEAMSQYHNLAADILFILEVEGGRIPDDIKLKFLTIIRRNLTGEKELF